MKKTLIVFILFLLAYWASAQDCIDYHKYNCPIIDPNPYTMVPEGSKSGLVLRGEIIELSFSIFQGRDYRIALCSEMYANEIQLRIYDAEDGTILLYDNTLNENAQEFEFQVMETRKVRCYVTIPKKENKDQNFGLLIEKEKRGCVAILTETMVTRK